MVTCGAHAHQGSRLQPNIHALVHSVHRAHRAGGTLYHLRPKVCHFRQKACSHGQNVDSHRQKICSRTQNGCHHTQRPWAVLYQKDAYPEMKRDPNPLLTPGGLGSTFPPREQPSVHIAGVRRHHQKYLRTSSPRVGTLSGTEPWECLHQPCTGQQNLVRTALATRSLMLTSHRPSRHQQVIDRAKCVIPIPTWAVLNWDVQVEPTSAQGLNCRFGRSDAKKKR